MRVHNFARTWLALLLLIVTGVSAQQKNPALANGDILTMVKGGLQETTVLNAIAANETDFDVSAKALLDLKQAGISDKIIDAMLAAEAKKRNTASPASASASPTSEAAATATPPGAQDAATAQALTQMGMTPQMLAQMPAASRQQMMMAMSQMRGMNGMAGMPGVGGPTPMVSSAMPKIALLIGTEKKTMTSSLAQMAQSKTKGMSGGGSATGSMLSSFASTGLSFAAIGGGMFAGPAMGIASGMFGGLMGGHHGMPTVTYIWALPGHNSPFLMPTTTPKFELEFGEIVGLDPDSYEPALVRLPQTKDNWRLVGATKTKLDYSGSGSPQSMIDEERTPLKTTRLSRGHLQIEAGAPLTAGEYGLVLRPVKAHKPKKGESQSEAEQGVFYSVWDFSVAGETAQEPKSKLKK
jgi:hypothetical protein